MTDNALVLLCSKQIPDLAGRINRCYSVAGVKKRGADLADGVL